MTGTPGSYHRRVLTLAAALGGACAGEPAQGPPPLRTGPTRVIAFTSPDGLAWTREPEPLAEHFVSLGLDIRADGALWVTGIDQSGRERGWWARTFGDPEAGGLVFDGTTWTRRTFSVDDGDAPALLDPQWSGEALWYAARSGAGGDPAEQGLVRIRSAPPATTWLEGPGITDPSPVAFRGAQHLFVSVRDRGVVHYTGDPLAEVQAWGRLEVPSAVVVGDALWLVAQARLQALRQPVLLVSQDGRTFSAPRPLLQPGLIEHCTSPVLGPSPAGGFVLLCVEETPPDQAPAGAPR